MSWNDELTIPRDLIVLIRERLGGSNPQYEQEGQVRQNKMNAEMIAGQLMAQGVVPTFKILGRALRVAPSTVNRWFKPGELEEARDRWAKLFDEKESCFGGQIGYASERCARLLVRNDNLPLMVRPYPTSHRRRAMPKRNRLSKSCPVFGGGGGGRDACLSRSSFALTLAVVAIFGPLQH